jgi:hypothetical protein
MKTAGIVSLKVTLRGSKPPIWRRLLVKETMNLGDLHIAIQVAMDWDGGHLHAFEVGGEEYGEPGSLEDAKSENRSTLKGIRARGVAKFNYTYDFGDDWEHVIEIEKKPVAEAPPFVPYCAGGKRAAPSDDTGGIWGYEELLAILADPDHPEREERLEWLDVEDFDPAAFDVEAVNETLARCFGKQRTASAD